MFFFGVARPLKTRGRISAYARDTDSLGSCCNMSVPQECSTRVSVIQECRTECPTRVSVPCKSAPECPTRVADKNASYKSVSQVIPAKTRVW